MKLKAEPPGKGWSFTSQENKPENKLVNIIFIRFNSLLLPHRNKGTKQKEIMKTLSTFTAGNTYQMNFIGDSSLRTDWVCTKRTAKTATFKSDSEKYPITRKIKIHGNYEYVLEGNYSMAPTIKAENIVIPVVAIEEAGDSVKNGSMDYSIDLLEQELSILNKIVFDWNVEGYELAKKERQSRVNDLERTLKVLKGIK